MEHIEEYEWKWAISTNDTNKLMVLLQADASLVYSKDIDDDLPLHYAATINRPQCITVLLQFGAPLDCTGCSGRTALHCAAYEKNHECLRLLLEHGASIQQQDTLEETVLHKLSTNGGTQSIKLIANQCPLDFRGLLNQRNCLGNTSIHNAVYSNHAEVVKLLLDFGADVELEDDFGMTPLQTAINRRSFACAQLLSWLLQNRQQPNIGSVVIEMIS